jgi:putative ABC transport system permease protein
LLAGAGLLIRSFLFLNAVDRGIETSRLLTVAVRLPYEKYKEPARGHAFFEQAIQRIKALPGVNGAATGSVVFDSFRGNAPNQNIVIEGGPSTHNPIRHGRNIVSEDYFHLLHIPLREGRLFSSEDIEGRPLVAVINESMARQFWPSSTPIGRRFKQVLPGMDGSWRTVIGVVGDVIYNRDGVVLPVFYSPARQWYFTARELIVKSAGDPRALISSLRHELQSVDPALPRFEISTVDDRLAEQDGPRRFQTWLLGIFAAIALVLAATGLYGLMAYSVEQRTKEIGIRVALGATRLGIARLVLREGFVWAAGGMAAGIAGTIAFGQILSASLYRISATDPGTLFAVSSLLVVVMVAALLTPALRARKVDPTVALRHE